MNKKIQGTHLPHGKNETNQPKYESKVHVATRNIYINVKLEIGRIGMCNVHPKGSMSFAVNLGSKLARLLRYLVDGKF